METIIIGGVRFRFMQLEHWADVEVGEVTPNLNDGCWYPGEPDANTYFSVVMYCNMQKDLFDEEE
jgi:hypothetical protein